MPILLYGSEVFGYENTDILDNVYNEFLRTITYARKSTPLYMLFGEMGRYPLHINIKYKIISFWLNLVTGKKQKLSYILYNFMLSHYSESFNWIANVKTILDTCGRSDIWINQHNLDNLAYHKQIREILIDQFKQSWYVQLSQSNKGIMYRSIKPEFGQEAYLKMLNKKDSQVLFAFRTANHKLPIETGRWDGTLLDHRICPLCDLDAVGSEKHSLLICTFFRQLRLSTIGDAQMAHRDSDVLFRSLLNPVSITSALPILKLIRVITNHFK